VSLGLLYNQSPLLSIPHLLFPSFRLYRLQVSFNIVQRPSFPSFGVQSSFLTLSSALHYLPVFRHSPTILFLVT
jgi:hypothetical protein